MTSGNYKTQIFFFGLPLLFGNILQQLYNFVDTVVVGRGISMNALAAVGTTGSINFLVLGFITGIVQGVSILAALFFGGQDYKKLRKAITMSFVLCMLFSLVITLLSVTFSKTMLSWMNTPPEILEDSVNYIHIIFYGIIVSMLYNFYSGILRGVGDSKNPLIAMVIAFFINTFLDVFFVMGLKMGVQGAALATVTAQAFSFLYCYFVAKKIDFIQLHKEDWSWDKDMFIRSFTLSVPVAVMNSITAVGVMILQAAINTFGALYIAAYSTASKVIILLEQIPSTFGFATGTFVGQNYGAEKKERIIEGVHSINMIVSSLCIVCVLVLFVFGRGIIGLMIGDQEKEVLDIAAHCLRFFSLFLIALGLLWIYRCSLQSMQDTFWPMISGVLEFILRLIFVLILPKFFGFDGILFAEVSAWIGAAFMLGMIYFKKLEKLDFGTMPKE